MEMLGPFAQRPQMWLLEFWRHCRQHFRTYRNLSVLSTSTTDHKCLLCNIAYSRCQAKSFSIPLTVRTGSQPHSQGPRLGEGQWSRSLCLLSFVAVTAKMCSASIYVPALICTATRCSHASSLFNGQYEEFQVDLKGRCRLVRIGAGKHRRAILAHNLLRKLEEATDESLEGEGNREVDVMKQWTSWQGIAKERSGKDLVDQMDSRRIATKHLGKPHSALHLRQSRHRVLCAQWFMGLFPRKPRSIAETLGGLGLWCVNTLKNLSKPCWTDEEEARIVKLSTSF